MKVVFAVGVLVISIVVIAFQQTGWARGEPRTVNLSSTTHSVDRPAVNSSGVAEPARGGVTPSFSLHPNGTSRFQADVRMQSAFIWPARGPISSYFGAYHV